MIAVRLATYPGEKSFLLFFEMNDFKFNFFVGIDISKHKLDYAVLSNKELIAQGTCPNSAEGITELIVKLKSTSRVAISKTLFVMEHTGIYTEALIKSLHKIKAMYVLENPLRLKASLGIARGKSDTIDAYRIAEYAFRHQRSLNLHTRKRPVLEKLSILMTLRNRLAVLNTSLSNVISEYNSVLGLKTMENSGKLVGSSRQSLKADLLIIEKEIQNIVEGDAALSHLLKLVTSVPRIGTITGIHIIIATNEFKNIDTAKKFASYAGVAPFTNESGTVKRQSRVSHIADKKIKALLHICALGGIQHVPELKAYYL